MDYNPDDSRSIESKGKQLINKTLLQLYPNIKSTNKKNKGEFGQLVEVFHFEKELDSKNEPDFPIAGVELKCCPLKANKKNQLSPKERLVFGIINYEKIIHESFIDSSFWVKNSLLLLIFYLYKQDEEKFNHLIQYAQLWRFPLEDILIIKEDWELIAHKVKTGRAHELSEGDTFYLGACTKGSTAKKSLRNQPFSDISAKQRAFSLKVSYIKTIIEMFDKGANTTPPIDSEYLKILNGKTTIISEESKKYQAITNLSHQPIIKEISQIPAGVSFSKFIINKFEEHYGMTEIEIANKYQLSINPKSKSKAYQICKGIFGIQAKKISEFEKANIELKTIKLEKTGTLKESMSFANIDYNTLVNETWEESYLYERLNRKFLFVIFKKDENDEHRLYKAMFWNMPAKDLEQAEKYWLDTKNKVEQRDFENFYKASHKKTFHVRPKGRNKLDRYQLSDGSTAPKKCYWLNARYIKQIISE